MVERNIWGTPVAHVGEGCCPQCERDGGRHYASCPFVPAPLRPCDCGTYWCTRDHDLEAAEAAHGWVI